MQLPFEVRGAAAAVVFYTVISIALNCLLIWLIWVHREWKSHIALLTYFTLASTTLCLVSQAYEYRNYKDIVISRWKWLHQHSVGVEVIAAEGAVGGRLTIWYFELYLFSVETLLIMFWALKLMQAVYGISRKKLFGFPTRHMDAIEKVTAVLLPILPIGLLQLQIVKTTPAAFIFLANFILTFCFVVAAVCLAAILGRYMLSRRRSSRNTQTVATSVTPAASTTSQPPMGFQSRAASAASTVSKGAKIIGTSDWWLFTRFAIGIIALVIYEIVHIFSETSGNSAAARDAKEPAPNLSPSRARESVREYLACAAPGYLVFIVFGTSSQCRQRMYDTFVPRRWKSKKNRDMEQDRVSNPREENVFPRSSWRSSSSHGSSNSDNENQDNTANDTENPSTSSPESPPWSIDKDIEMLSLPGPPTPAATRTIITQIPTTTTTNAATPSPPPPPPPLKSITPAPSSFSLLSGQRGPRVDKPLPEVPSIYHGSGTLSPLSRRSSSSNKKGKTKNSLPHQDQQQSRHNYFRHPPPPSGWSETRLPLKPSSSSLSISPVPSPLPLRPPSQSPITPLLFPSTAVTTSSSSPPPRNRPRHHISSQSLSAQLPRQQQQASSRASPSPTPTSITTVAASSSQSTTTTTTIATADPQGQKNGGTHNNNHHHHHHHRGHKHNRSEPILGHVARQHQPKKRPAPTTQAAAAVVQGNTTTTTVDDDVDDDGDVISGSGAVPIVLVVRKEELGDMETKSSPLAFV